MFIQKTQLEQSFPNLLVRVFRKITDPELPVIDKICRTFVQVPFHARMSGSFHSISIRILKFLKLQVILGNLAEDFKKIADALLVLFPSSADLELLFGSSSRTKHEIGSQLRKPTNLLSVFPHCSNFSSWVV